MEMGYNMSDIKESLAENAYDEICATYMLLGSTPEHQENSSSLSHPSTSSLSPINPMDNSSPLTPTGVSSTRGEVAGGSGGGYKYSSPSSSKPHSSSVTSSSGSHSANKKISAPGVPTSVSKRLHVHVYMYCMCMYM